MGSIPGSGRSPGKGNGYLLQYSCLQNPKDRGTWRATFPGVARVGHDLATTQQQPQRCREKITELKASQTAVTPKCFIRAVGGTRSISSIREITGQFVGGKQQNSVRQHPSVRKKEKTVC